jgi:hypothetical protein
VLREVLIEAGAEFCYGLLDVFVEGGHNRANLFFGDGLVVRVEVRPDRDACLDVAQLHFHGDAANESGSRDFLEVIEPAGQKKLSANIAAKHIDAAKMARGAELPKQNLGDHLCWRFRPALIFVEPHALAAGAVNDLVRAIESWTREASDEQGDGNWIGAGRRREIAGNGELVIVARPGGAASGRETQGQRKYRERDFRGRHGADSLTFAYGA